MVKPVNFSNLNLSGGRLVESLWLWSKSPSSCKLSLGFNAVGLLFVVETGVKVEEDVAKVSLCGAKYVLELLFP